MARKRSLYGLVAAVVVTVMAAWLVWANMSPGPQADAERLVRVNEMYAEYRTDFPKVAGISPWQAMRLNREGKAVFVDVRPEEERVVSILPGAITREEYLKNTQAYQGKTPITYCTISYRSGKWAEEMLEEGVKIYNLEGGLLGWLHAGGKMYHNGKPATKVHVYGSRWDLAPVKYRAVY